MTLVKLRHKNRNLQFSAKLLVTCDFCGVRFMRQRSSRDAAHGLDFCCHEHYFEHKRQRGGK